MTTVKSFEDCFSTLESIRDFHRSFRPECPFREPGKLVFLRRLLIRHGLQEYDRKFPPTGSTLPVLLG